jgi:heme oxygenase (mycobilin-producing)
MTVVRINAITVSEGSGDELARRFAARAGAVDQAEGFLGFELLRPTDERNTWLVVTRWRDEDAFQAWVRSPAFAHGHRGLGGGRGEHGHAGPGGGGGHTGPGGGDTSDHQGEDQSGRAGDGDAPPIASRSELWSYDVVDLGRGR